MNILINDLIYISLDILLNRLFTVLFFEPLLFSFLEYLTLSNDSILLSKWLPLVLDILSKIYSTLLSNKDPLFNYIFIIFYLTQNN